MIADQASIKKALETVNYPGYSRNIVSFGLVKEIVIKDNHIAVTLELTSHEPKIAEALKAAVEAALSIFEKDYQIEVFLNVKEPQAKPTTAQVELKNIKYKIAIASGKGGVGKSTVAVNLAYALHLQGATVGILDCDIYGPTVPLMLGATGEPEVQEGKLVPFVAHGMKVMSMGLLIDENTPVVWRGPMITKTIQQFATQVLWGERDYLIIDLPPGTGDAQLTLAQTISLTGAIIVTTPQEAATQVAARGAQMFAKVGVPILGVVENMSYYILPGGKKDFVFGTGGGAELAKALSAPLLAQIPLSSGLRENADRGQPILAAEEKGSVAGVYKGLAKKLIKIVK